MDRLYQYIEGFKALKTADGGRLYAGADPDFLRLMSASLIYNSERSGQLYRLQKGVCDDQSGLCYLRQDGLADVTGDGYAETYRVKGHKAAYEPGESLGFLDIIASADTVDTEGEQFSAPAVLMGQHVAAYKAYRYGRAYFDMNHNGQADRRIVPVESHPIEYIEKGQRVRGWHYLLYLDSPELRQKAEQGQIHGLSVAGAAFA